MPKGQKRTQAEVKPISEGELTRAALNLPANEFMLGERKFEIKDLSYRDYLAFTRYLTPFMEAVGSRLISDKLGVSVPGIDLGGAISATSIIDFCGEKLPEMVQIICRQTDPSITVEEIEALAKKPSALIGPVVQQIVHSKVVSDFASFFAQAMTLLSPNQNPKT